MPRKKKSDSDSDLLLQLAESSGGEVLSKIGKSKYFINSGNLALNYICSGKFLTGGFPTGISEVYGPPASSKSLLGYTILGACQLIGGIPVLLDCERAANKDFAISAGHVDADRLIVFAPISIEEVGRKITSITKKIREVKGPDVPIVFVWDSIGVTPSEREWRETSLPDNFTEAQFKKIVGGNEQPGERAKACGKLLRQINPFLAENNASLMVINQIRDSIGFMSGEVTAGGGKALPFYANMRMRTKAAKHIEDTEKEIAIGVNLVFQNKKNRHFSPFWKVENVPLYFDKGIDPLGGLMKVLLSAGRIEKTGQGSYKVSEPWANGEEIKFRASKEANRVPVEVLEKCPSLVDASNFEEIKDFLGVFADAIALTDSGSTKETDIDDDDNDSTDDYDKATEKLGLDEHYDVEE